MWPRTPQKQLNAPTPLSLFLSCRRCFCAQQRIIMPLLQFVRFIIYILLLWKILNKKTWEYHGLVTFVCWWTHAVDSRGGGYIFLDIRRMWFGCGEQEQQQRGNTSWDSNCLGAGCDSAGLLCWPHLWCPFQSCCYHCFCLHQKVSLDAGYKTTTFFLDYELGGCRKTTNCSTVPFTVTETVKVTPKLLLHRYQLTLQLNF